MFRFFFVSGNSIKLKIVEIHLKLQQWNSSRYIEIPPTHALRQVYKTSMPPPPPPYNTPIDSINFNVLLED